MRIIAGSAFAGLSCIGLMKVFQDLGVGEYPSGVLSFIVVVVLSVMNNMER